LVYGGANGDADSPMMEFRYLFDVIDHRGIEIDAALLFWRQGSWPIKRLMEEIQFLEILNVRIRTTKWQILRFPVVLFL